MHNPSTLDLKFFNRIWKVKKISLTGVLECATHRQLFSSKTFKLEMILEIFLFFSLFFKKKLKIKIFLIKFSLLFEILYGNLWENSHYIRVRVYKNMSLKIHQIFVSEQSSMQFTQSAVNGWKFATYYFINSIQYCMLDTRVQSRALPFAGSIVNHIHCSLFLLATRFYCILIYLQYVHNKLQLCSIASTSACK